MSQWILSAGLSWACRGIQGKELWVEFLASDCLRNGSLCPRFHNLPSQTMGSFSWLSSWRWGPLMFLDFIQSTPLQRCLLFDQNEGTL